MIAPASAATSISYDDLPYPSVPKVWTHPDRLATLARLFGMDPPPVARCRVLELGCSDGGNLLPMAVALPRSEFVGVDYAPGQIAAGQTVVQALGLPNITLHAQDVRTLGDDLGQFDYIIAYGIYSWVPPDAQEAILRLCKQHLAPNGVAFVSYNTYPGWHVRAMVREMLLYHAGHAGRTDDVRERVAQARATLDFLADSVATLRGRSANGGLVDIPTAILQREREHLRNLPDTYLAHELLEDMNAPVYFHEFVARAEQHGLQYLAEAEFAVMQLEGLPEPVAEGLRQISRSRIEAEQYLDFLRNRAFRQTLLCHVGLALAPAPAAIAGLAVASPAVPLPASSATSPTPPVAPMSDSTSSASDSPAPDLEFAAAVRFRGPSGSVIRMSSPVGKAALFELRDCWPQALPFWEVLRRARARLGRAASGREAGAGGAAGCLYGEIEDPSQTVTPPSIEDDPEARLLAQQLLHCCGLDLVELHSVVPAFTLEPGAQPVACPLARYQVQHGVAVANRRHEAVRLEDGLALTVLELLDGSRDRAALLAEVERRIVTDDLDVPEGDDVARRRILAGAIEDALQLLSRSAVLVG